jgi:hypothetical protein
MPSIYVNYSANCTFTLTVDGGISVTSVTAPGPTLPPGTYELAVWLPNPTEGYVPCGRPTFTLSGPGVSARTEFAGMELLDERTVVLQPSATYQAEDANAPGSTRRFFTTAASGSNSVLLGSGPPAPSGPARGSVQNDPMGSAIPRYRGKLAATIGRAGKATLTRGGTRVATLKAGRYDLAVDDGDAHAGFFVRHGAGKPLTVTSLAFVGSTTKRLSLTAGTWSFFSKAGPATTFRVVA